MSNPSISLTDLASNGIDPRRVKIDPRKLRYYRSRIEPTDPDELKSRNKRRLDLADSWLEDPLSDIIVRDGDFAIADGNERVAGILQRGVDEITVALLPASTPDSKLDEISLLTDYYKTKLKTIEQAAVAKRLLDSTGAKKGDIAAKLKIDNGYVTKLLSLYDCPDEVRQAAEAGRLGVNDWYACSKSPDPLETLRIKLDGGGREAVQRSAKQPKAAPAVRTAKIKVPLVSGATVTVASEGVSMEEALEAVQEAAKQIKAAIAKGITAKRAMRYWKDIAAAAG